MEVLQGMEKVSNEAIVESIQRGEGNRKELLAVLWNNNIRFVRKIIHESTGLESWKETERQDFEDLEQQAFLGMMDAISGYDCCHGYKFLTYAKPYIIKSIFRYYYRFGQMLRVPEYMRARIKAYMKAKSNLSNAGEPVTREILREHLGMTEQELDNIEVGIQRLELKSLDSYLKADDKESGTVKDMIADQVRIDETASDSVYLDELHRTLTAALSRLPDVEREIITDRFYHEYSVKYIAKMRGCTSWNIHLHLKMAYERMRTGKYGRELASFLPEQAIIRAERKIARDFKELTEEERGLLL